MEISETAEPIEPRKKVPHLCMLRLKDTAGISVDSPDSLVRAGYASIAMGLYTAFRPTPLLVFILTRYHQTPHPVYYIDKMVVFILMFTWIGLLMFVLIILGSVLVAAQKVVKRWALLLHSWGLLLLYLDVFVWISLILLLQVEVWEYPEVAEKTFDHVHYPEVYFIIMYVECVLFCVLYYLYATYFIAAELTVIERFF